MDHLGPDWITRWSDSNPASREYARVALELMENITSPAVIDRLSDCGLYRLRTNVIFGVTWSTEDNHTSWPSVSTSDIVEMENAWARDRLQHFDLHYFDNIYIAEDQHRQLYRPDMLSSTRTHRLHVRARRARKGEGMARDSPLPSRGESPCTRASKY